MNRWPKHGHLPAIALLIVLTLGFGVTAVRAGSGTITVSGNPPEAVSIAIDTYPTTPVNATHITVDTQHMIVLNATDPDQLTDVQKIEVQLYTDSYNATGDIRHHYSFLWTPGGGFANVSPEGS
jgi:hypothetical protein